MSRISIPEEPPQEPDQAQPDVEMLADPDDEDASGELESRPAQPSVAFLATVLEAPAFSRVGARGRKQHLKQIPTTLSLSHDLDQDSAYIYSVQRGLYQSCS
jgi:hypothetical protein